MSLWYTVDFRELEQLQDKVERLSKAQMKKFFEDCCKELAARLLGKVIPATPVKTGALKRGWTAGKEQNPRAFAYSLPVQKVSDGYIITITNIMDYATFVEYPHKTRSGGMVEGRFMLRNSEIELEAELPSVIKERMLKLLGEVFDVK